MQRAVPLLRANIIVLEDLLRLLFTTLYHAIDISKTIINYSATYRREAFAGSFPYFDSRITFNLFTYSLLVPVI